MQIGSGSEFGGLCYLDMVHSTLV